MHKRIANAARKLGLTSYISNGRTKIEHTGPSAAGRIIQLFASLGCDVRRDGASSWAVSDQDGNHVALILADAIPSGFAYMYTVTN